MAAIKDLAFLSDCRTAALVDGDGAIVWYPPDEFAGPTVFASLLDDDAGAWRIGPVDDARVTRAYEDGSLVLRTTFETAVGTIAITDLLALARPGNGHAIGRDGAARLVRIVEGIRGRVEMDVSFAPRLEYGLTIPWLTRGDDGSVRAEAGPHVLRLDTELRLEVGRTEATARFTLGAGECVTFVATSWRPLEAPEPPRVDAASLRETTLAAWRAWRGSHTSFEGAAAALVQRSATVLQGLTDHRTGGVVAAATTSLPEVLGGDANWDYRYVWLRDLSFVMRALWVAACPDEADRLIDFVASALGRIDDRRIPILLGSDGRQAALESTLTHLRGFGGSQPVRVGNDAWRQRQLDVYGEVLDSAALFGERLVPIPDRIRELLRTLADRAAADWRRNDAGMWEARDRERPYTSSKVMCWVALDRAIRLAPHLGDDAPVDAWRSARDEIRATVLAEAWNEDLQAFAGALGSDRLDASVLLMPLVGFLPADDPRMAATIDRIRERLTSGPLVHRWDGDPNGFLLCSYWLVECEALLGDVAGARQRFDALNALANDVGLLAEMADPSSGELAGNVPQAFSHVGLINAAWRLTEATDGADGDTAPPPP